MIHSDGRIVVTTGQQWADIDAFACVIAYTEALNLAGEHAVAVIPGALNASIPDEYRIFNFDHEPPKEYSAIVVCDVSDPNHIANFAKPESIEEVFDHHSGHEAFWIDRIGTAAHIETTGAAATLVWESIRKASLTQKLQPETAKLIAAAIASNTLNFQIQSMIDRDIVAFREASKLGGFDDVARTQYFSECERLVLNDFSRALVHDTKLQNIPQYSDQIAIGQLELWHSEPVIRAFKSTIQSTLSAFSPTWFLTAPSIGDGYTVMYCTNADIQGTLSRVLHVGWNDDIGRIDHLILRKEILKALRNGS